LNKNTYISLVTQYMEKVGSIIRLSTIWNGNGYNLEKVRQMVQSGWGDDPVHPYKHTYAKMALKLMERMSANITENREGTSRKRTWSVTNSESGSGGSGGGGGSGRPTHRSTSWKESRNSGTQDAGYQGGHGGHYGVSNSRYSSGFDNNGDRYQSGGGGGRPRQEYCSGQ
jgi:hypothetical protein